MIKGTQPFCLLNFLIIIIILLVSCDSPKEVSAWDAVDSNSVFILESKNIPDLPDNKYQPFIKKADLYLSLVQKSSKNDFDIFYSYLMNRNVYDSILMFKPGVKDQKITSRLLNGFEIHEIKNRANEIQLSFTYLNGIFVLLTTNENLLNNLKKMWNKELPDGTWVERVDHLEQSPEENLAEIAIGFFSANLLNKENLRKILIDVVEFANTHTDTFCEEVLDSSEKINKLTAEEHLINSFTLSSSFVFQRIAETIAEELGDLEFAREVFLRCEELAVDEYDLESLAESVNEYLQDVEWSNKLMAKAKTMSKDIPKLLTLENGYSVN